MTWIKKVPPAEPPHIHTNPGFGHRNGKWSVGSIWQCKCGVLLECTEDYNDFRGRHRTWEYDK